MRATLRTEIRSRVDRTRNSGFPFHLPEPHVRFCVLESIKFMEAKMGRGLLLWLLGVPIPVIILLWLFFGR
jgi:hypothetical protein